MSEDRFPRGKLNAEDDGQVEVRVGTRDRTVIVEFEHPAKWLGLDKQTALSLGAAITKHANTLP